METEGSLSHSQQPATYPMQSEINPVNAPIPLIEDPF